MTDHDARLERVLAGITRPGPVHDSHVDLDRDDWMPQRDLDALADERADLEHDRNNR